MFINHKFF